MIAVYQVKLSLKYYTRTGLIIPHHNCYCPPRRCTGREVGREPISLQCCNRDAVIILAVAFVAKEDSTTANTDVIVAGLMCRAEDINSTSH